MDNLLDKAKGMLVGLAIGDAVGTSVEFMPRGSFMPVTDMTGGGPFNLEKGQWTDDTSMALCLSQSLIDKRGFDPVDQIERYSRWYTKGYMSSTGECFDIGGTVLSALQRYAVSGEPYAGSDAPSSAGNGSIMRLAPIVIVNQENKQNLLEQAINSSRVTHACKEVLESCQLFAKQLRLAMHGVSKEEIIKEHGFSSLEEKVRNIAEGDFLTKSYEELNGSGYVINTLETALWCFYYTYSYKEAILKTVNVGNDADTTAAVCGQIAGAYYGYQAIPDDWRKDLYLEYEIANMADQLFSLGNEA